MPFIQLTQIHSGNEYLLLLDVDDIYYIAPRWKSNPKEPTSKTLIRNYKDQEYYVKEDFEDIAKAVKAVRVRSRR